MRIRPGNLEVYLEFLGLNGYRRLIYKVGSSYKVRHDDRLVADLEAALGAGNVRLLGHGGATTRSAARPASPARPVVYTDAPSDESDED